MKKKKSVKKFENENPDAMALKYLRQDAGLTQKEVAEYLNIPRSCLSEWENGIHEIKASVVMKMAGLYGCTPSQILLACEKVLNCKEK